MKKVSEREKSGVAGMRATGLPAARAGRVGFPFAKPFLEVLRGLYRILHAIVGRARGREVRASGCAFFLLVLFGVFDVPQVKAEWTDVDTQRLLEIITRLDAIKQSVDDVPNPNNLLSSIEQAVNGQQSKIGVGRLISTQEDFHHTFLTRFGFAGSGNDLSGRLLSMQNILSSMETKEGDIFNALGYTGTQKLKTDMSTIVTKLEAIRAALSSSGTSGGITQEQLSSALQSQFGAKFGLSGSSNPKVLAYSVNDSGFWINEIFDTGSIPVLFSRLNQQITFLGDFLKYWNGKYFNNVTTRLDDIISKMGTGGGGSDLSNIEQYLQTLNGYLMGDSSSGGMYGMFTTVSKPMGGFTFKQLLADSIRKQPESLYVALRNLSSMNSQGFSYLSENLYSLGQLMASMDYQQTLSEMRDLLMEIADNTKSGSSSGGGGGLTSEELDAMLSKYFGLPYTGTIYTPGNTKSQVIGGLSFGQTYTDTVGVGSLRDFLRYILLSQTQHSNVSTSNDVMFAELFWRAIIGSSGSSTSDLVRDGFVSYSFGDSPAFYPDGKPWRQYTESKFWSPSSLLEALALINMNLARFSNVQSKNMYALGDQNYWATTNIISHLNPETYWGEKKDNGKDSEYIYRFGEGADGSTDGKPFNPTNYSPTISQAYTNYTNTIMADTNRLDVVENDKILQKYFLEAAFKADGSSATIQFEGTDSDWGNIEITLPTFGGARGNGPTFTLELKKGWAEIKPQAAAMLNNWLRPVCVAVWWFFGGLACFVMVRKVGGI